MKKIYKNPEMEIIKVKAQQLLAGSEIEAKGEYGDGITLGGREDEYDW